MSGPKGIGGGLMSGPKGGLNNMLEDHLHTALPRAATPEGYCDPKESRALLRTFLYKRAKSPPMLGEIKTLRTCKILFLTKDSSRHSRLKRPKAQLKLAEL